MRSIDGGSLGIYCVVDRRFLPLATTFLRSVEKNYPRHPPIVFLHVDLDAADVAKLTCFSNVNVRSIQVSDFRGESIAAPLRGAIASYGKTDLRVIYGRFLLWHPEFDAHDRIVFLDVDVLVLKPLDALFDEDGPVFTREMLAPTRNFYDDDAPGLREKLASLGLKTGERGANAGCFMLPRAVRTVENFREMFRIATTFSGHLVWGDQSVINVWLWMHRIAPREDLRFNFQMLRLPELGAAALSTAAVAHYNGMDERYRLTLMRGLLALHDRTYGWERYLRFQARVMKVMDLVYWLETKGRGLRRRLLRIKS